MKWIQFYLARMSKRSEIGIKVLAGHIQLDKSISCLFAVHFCFPWMIKSIVNLIFRL